MPTKRCEIYAIPYPSRINVLELNHFNVGGKSWHIPAVKPFCIRPFGNKLWILSSHLRLSWHLYSQNIFIPCNALPEVVPIHGVKQPPKGILTLFRLRILNFCSKGRLLKCATHFSRSLGQRTQPDVSDRYFLSFTWACDDHLSPRRFFRYRPHFYWEKDH